MKPRLRTLADLHIPWMREYGGRHEYDGVIQDLSPQGVASALAALPQGVMPAQTYDEALLRTHEHAAHVYYGEIGMHRRNPLDHLLNLDLSCYARHYAPEAERAAARKAHLRQWPEACDAAITALDALSAPVAQALLGSFEGLTAGLHPDDAADAKALAAHERLMKHLRHSARHGEPSGHLGTGTLATLVGASEALDIDLSALEAKAAIERARMQALLEQSCEQYRPGEPIATVVNALNKDHPNAQDVLTQAQELTKAVLEWTKHSGLVPYADGKCLVEQAPAARRTGAAMISWAAPDEDDAAAIFFITPPENTWPVTEQEQWLEQFSATTLPVICVHEVAPGHFSHSRALRRATSPERRLLPGHVFIEGWAHYAEELALEEGFGSHDPRFGIGVALEALLRITRLRCAIGVHSGALSHDAAQSMFMHDAYLSRAAATSETHRAVFDPTYGRYTMGKIAIRELRARAQTRWGDTFSLARFHHALLELGSPPLGLMDTILD
ncbi:MAG: DUF885 family protein [Corynebacteriales bacterium]|nr:DUF885 family protein [Mycobacteriales bacterium]